jgi:AcrR family transcriptional regulator
VYRLDKIGLSCQDGHMPQIAVDSGTPTREDEIVDAAIPVFLRFGYKKASMDSVAAAANLSRQAVYLHFSGKEALFAAVVNSLCQSTRQAAHVALWRDGLTLDEQVLAAFDETMPHESMELLSELLTTARELVPQSVEDIDRLVVQEVSNRLHDALGNHQWPVPGVTIEQAANVLQATSYGIKQQTASRDEYLLGMKSAISLTLAAGGLTTPSPKPNRRNSRSTNKGR